MPADLHPLSHHAAAVASPVTPAAPAPSAPSPPAVPPVLAPRAFVRALRPRQWTKNLLVLAAPAAAGVLTTGAGLRSTAVAFVALTLAAGSTYLLNDLIDLDADRRHPTKCRRPLAAGQLSPSVALVGVPVLAVAAVLVGATVSPTLALVAACYVGLTVAYTLWLKHEPVLDIAAIAGGFILRVFAGAVAVDVPVSRWFVIVASFGSLFVVVGKRRGELRELGSFEAGEVRATLRTYSEAYLSSTGAICAGVAMVAYCLWAFEAPPAQSPWLVGSIVPFVVAVLRY
ncbi:decaprenyl-phosphate phosphoribosyltransferase, partial [cyanobacterium TDX16]